MAKKRTRKPSPATAKSRLLTVVRQIGKQHDEEATRLSREAIRTQDAALVTEAAVAVAKDDACTDMAEELVGQIEQYWPA